MYNKTGTFYQPKFEKQILNYGLLKTINTKRIIRTTEKHEKVNDKRMKHWNKETNGTNFLRSSSIGGSNCFAR